MIRTLTTKTALVAVGLAACLGWFYGPLLAEMMQRWSSENNYSHSFLVPGFAAILLWLRAELVKDIKPGLYWSGLALLVAGALLRLAGAYIYFDWLEGVSLLVYIAGVFVLLGGKPALRWSWPALAFMVFMIPLPYRIERSLALPLQRIATKASTYSLQTLGVPALSEGNVVLLSEVRVGIVEACNGLGMLMSFVALATGLALVIRRPWLDKLIIVLSAVPIAIVSNVIRVTGTGVLHETVGAEIADKVFHNLAGWVMMPIALALLWLELKILGRLLITQKKEKLGPISALAVAGGKAAPRGGKRPTVAPAKT